MHSFIRTLACVWLASCDVLCTAMFHSFVAISLGIETMPNPNVLCGTTPRALAAASRTFTLWMLYLSSPSAQIASWSRTRKSPSRDSSNLKVHDNQCQSPPRRLQRTMDFEKRYADMESVVHLGQSVRTARKHCVPRIGLSNVPPICKQFWRRGEDTSHVSPQASRVHKQRLIVRSSDNLFLQANERITLFSIRHGLIDSKDAKHTIRFVFQPCCLAIRQP